MRIERARGLVSRGGVRDFAGLVRELVSESMTDEQLNFAGAALGDLPLAIHLINRTGHLTYCNAAVASFAGPSPASATTNGA